MAANFTTFAWLFLYRGGRVSLHDRALWMHHSCRRVARALGMNLATIGILPKTGLITSNHLSYLDILAFASAGPFIFVSKSDVLQWPIFGMLARYGGTLFVNRERRTAVGAITQQMEAILSTGLPLVLFPEGTSTDGSHMLPYFPSLLEPALRCSAPITPAAVGYRADGWHESDFCYYGEISFVPHLRSILRIPRSQMHLSFGPQTGFSDRKQAARQLREQTAALRSQMRSLTHAGRDRSP